MLKFLFLVRFNKREEEFPSLREYNDFLEEIEEIGRCGVVEYKNIFLLAFTKRHLKQACPFWVNRKRLNPLLGLDW